ncbi:MAG: Tryptophan synthase alpha chain [Methanosaeta sp. PtaB.Bin039]|nr:MAG: Tryptophan synthase alpha chain [Methanosaeta sp. PtaB.Bin039]
MRVADAFSSGPALIVYLCMGDPDIKTTIEAARRVIAAGADLLELGLPHSDPIADGPVIQAAAQRAIAAGMDTDRYFQAAGKIEGIPKVFMGYYNMVFQRGVERFAADCAASGISGLIVPDLPPEEANPLMQACKRYDLDLIFLVAPNTPQQRAEEIAAMSSGFVYLVSRSGVTGARKEVLDSTRELIARVPAVRPRAVGFGISTPDQAAQMVAAGAEGVIVGSACVDLVGQGRLDKLEELVMGMKKEMIKVAPKR